MSSLFDGPTNDPTTHEEGVDVEDSAKSPRNHERHQAVIRKSITQLQVQMNPIGVSHKGLDHGGAVSPRCQVELIGFPVSAGTILGRWVSSKGATTACIPRLR